MAFMVPVMKNNYDIYTNTRSRKTSECSNLSSGGGGNGTVTLNTAIGTPTTAGGGGQPLNSRRRKVSECKSESFATSPSHGQLGAHRMQMQRCHSSRGFTRNSSTMMMMSPTRSYAAGVGATPTMATNSSSVVSSSSSPTSRGQTLSALEKHAAQQKQQQQQQQQQEQSDGNDYTKFHLRLVNKLRKSFRKDTAKRS